LAFVYFAFNQDVNLVRDDYYAEELKYESKIKKIKRAKKLTESLKVSVKEKSIQINFPKNIKSKNISGEVLFYRPSDRARDILLPILVDSLNQQSVSLNKMLKGMWKVQVDWAVNDITYFNEEIIMVN
jgi:hypothetical protein